MLRENHTAVIARNELWQGSSATEPHEAGWAIEALIFVRALAIDGPLTPVPVSVQVSADGMRWVDEGTRFELPRTIEADSWARIRHFGNWLRLSADLPAGLTMKVLVTLHLK
jgi:hypothetical protein